MYIKSTCGHVKVKNKYILYFRDSLLLLPAALKKWGPIFMFKIKESLLIHFLIILI